MLDANCAGESTVQIAFINGSTESFELASLSNLKQSALRSEIHDSQKFERLTRKITDRVAEAESKLFDIIQSIQKEFTEYATECQFISKSVSRMCAVLRLETSNRCFCF